MRTALTALALVLVMGQFFVISPSASAQPAESDPATTAIQLSEYERLGQTGYLLKYLHLDARTTIPSAAIDGWYRDEYLSAGPGPITVTGVTYVDWTWKVNGVTYPNTAEVSFTQPYADGETHHDVIRLVEYGGTWHWFFGRDRDFVNAQIARYAPDAAMLTGDRETIVNGHVPWGVTDRLSLLETDIFLAGAPAMLGPLVLNPRVGVIPRFADSGSARQVAYHRPPERAIPSAVVGVVQLDAGTSVAQLLDQLAHPVNPYVEPTILLAGDDEEAGVTFLLIEEYQNDAVGAVPALYWGAPGTNRIFYASATDYVMLPQLVQGLLVD